ncbi:MAG: hypothetical protein Unbinned2851contig1000_13 [Prokaryotic dsDNA virus sp.]|nr:MAG: hypothetical protein Unbinned2851contig1000_13 [Prokaryotic dsDNA virus sp.]|tara:strand:- start:35548 stop:35757 length:210 start_codon:yes stop_codon:yes gene_type:complete
MEVKNLDEKIVEMEENQTTAIAELQTAQSKVNELQNLLQRQQGAITILRNLKKENEPQTVEGDDSHEIS